MKGKDLKKWIVLVCTAAVMVVSVLAVTLFVSPHGIRGGIQDSVSVITEPVSSAAGGIKKGFRGLLGFKSQIKENEALKEENRKLRQDNRNLRMEREEKEELQELCRIFDYQIPAQSRVAAANVTGMDYSGWQKTFTIDKGRSRGIEKGSAVVCGDGLVGKVSEVSERTSKVTAILTDKIKISIKIQGRSGQTGVLQSDGKGAFKGYLLEEDAVARKGDLLITSGIGTYPAGVVGGSVTEVKKDEDSQGVVIKARPSMSFFSLEKVGVLQ